MGSFDSTCAITRTVVTNGDRVLLIMIPCVYNEYEKRWYPHRYLADTYNFMTRLGSTARQLTKTKKRGLGELSESLIKVQKEFLEQIFFSFGTYNDYGWINEVDIDDDKYNPDHVVFIHRDVVDTILKKYYDAEIMDSLDEYAPLLAVAHFAFLARIQLFGNVALGQQYGLYEKSEEDAIRLANKLQRKKLIRYTRTRFNSWFHNLTWKIDYKIRSQLHKRR